MALHSGSISSSGLNKQSSERANEQHVKGSNASGRDRRRHGLQSFNLWTNVVVVPQSRFSPLLIMGD